MKKVSELKPGDRVRNEDLILVVKSVWNEDGQTKILFHDIPWSEENEASFRNLVEKTGGMGILAPVSSKDSGYKESPLCEALMDNFEEEQAHDEQSRA